MGLARDILVAFSVLIVWHVCYMWLYNKASRTLKKGPLSNLQNILLFLFTPPIAAVTILYLFTAKMLYFLDKEN